MSCPICGEIDKRENTIYEDKICVAMLHPAPAVKGHILVAPRDHHPILEQTPTETVEHMFIVANKASTLVFEGLGVQGTNITVNNGLPAGQDTPHFTINVLPRNPNDGIDFNFTRKQATPEELKTVQSQLKDCTVLIGHEKPKAPVFEAETETMTGGEENYLIKQLQRIP